MQLVLVCKWFSLLWNVRSHQVQQQSVNYIGCIFLQESSSNVFWYIWCVTWVIRKNSPWYLHKYIGNQGLKWRFSKEFLLPIGLHQENLSLRGKESCRHQLLVLCYRGCLCVVNNHVLEIAYVIFCQLSPLFLGIKNMFSFSLFMRVPTPCANRPILFENIVSHLIGYWLRR